MGLCHFHCPHAEIHNLISWTRKRGLRIHHPPIALLYRFNHQSTSTLFHSQAIWDPKMQQPTHFVHFPGPWQVARMYVLPLHRYSASTFSFAVIHVFRNVPQSHPPKFDQSTLRYDHCYNYQGHSCSAGVLSALHSPAFDKYRSHSILARRLALML